MLECLLKDANDITSFRTVCNLPFNYKQQETISKNCEGSKLHNDLMNELVVIVTANVYMKQFSADSVKTIKRTLFCEYPD